MPLGYGELAEVAAGALHLNIDTAVQLDGAVFRCFAFGDEDDTFLHHGAHAFIVGAGALKEGFDGIGGVDQLDDALAVSDRRLAEVELWGASGDGGHRTIIDFSRRGLPGGSGVCKPRKSGCREPRSRGRAPWIALTENGEGLRLKVWNSR